MKPALILAAFLVVGVTARMDCSETTFLDTAAIANSLQSLKVIDIAANVVNNATSISATVLTKQSVTAARLWQVISCFASNRPPALPAVFGIDLWKLDVDSLQIVQQQSRFVVSLITRQISELRLLPPFLMLHDVDAKLTFPLTGVNELLNVSVKGAWRLKQKSVLILANWLGSSLSLSFPKAPSFLNVPSVMEHINEETFWNTISSTLTPARLQGILNMKNIDMKGDLTNMLDCTKQFVLTAEGVTETELLETMVTRFFLHVRLTPPEARTSIVCDVISSTVIYEDRDGPTTVVTTSSSASPTLSMTNTVYTISSQSDISTSATTPMLETDIHRHIHSTEAAKAIPSSSYAADSQTRTTTMKSVVIHSTADTDTNKDDVKYLSSRPSSSNYHEENTATSATKPKESGTSATKPEESATDTTQPEESVTSSTKPAFLTTMDSSTTTDSPLELVTRDFRLKRSANGNSGSALQEITAILVSEIDSGSSAFSSLINSYIGIDISTLKLTTSIQLEGILVVSSVSVSKQKITELNINPLASHCGGIKQGLTAIVSINLASKSSTIFEIYWDETIKTRVCSGGLSLPSPIPFITSFFPLKLPSLNSLLSVLNKLRITVPEPTDLRYLIGDKVVVFDFLVDKVLDLIPSLAQVSLTNFQVKVPLQDISLPSLTALSSWNLGSFSWQGVSFSVRDYIPQVKWTAQILNIADFLSNLKLSFLPKPLLVPLKAANFLDFDIDNPSISLTFSDFPSTFRLQLQGLAIFNGWSIETEGLVSRVTSNYALALGIVAKDVSLADLLTTLFGLKLLNLIPFFKTSFTIGIVVSDVNIPDLTFDNELLSKVSTIPGVSLVAPFKLPSTCDIDLLCKFAKQVLPDGLILTGDISSLDKLVLTVPIGDISFGLKLKKVSLEFKLDGPFSLIPQHTIGMSAELELDIFGKKFQFKGSIRQGQVRLELEMKMIGWWTPLPFLSLGDGLLGLGVNPPSLLPTLIQIELDIKIGIIGNGKEIRTTVAMRLDLQNPVKNYYYGHISKFTLSALLNAFDVSLPIPPIIGDMGFPNGLHVSFSSSPLPIRILRSDNNIIIPTGYSFSGTLNFLGLQMFAKISLTPLSYAIEACLESKIILPLGLVELSRSSSNRNAGPCLKATIDFTSDLNIDVCLNGYISLFRGALTKEIKLVITENKIEAQFSAKLFQYNLNIILTGAYGNLLATKFRVAAHVTTDILGRIGRGVKDILRSAGDKANSVVNGLQSTLDAAKAVFDKANSFLSARQNDLHNAERKLAGPKRVLDSAQRKVDGLCKIRSCSSACVGCPGWNGCCFKVWGKCVGCPSWRSCCFRVSDPICSGANVLCRTVRSAANLALAGAKVAYNAVLSPFRVAELALEGAKVALKAAKLPFDAAKRALELGRQAMAVGLKAVELLAGFVLGEAVDVKSIKLEAGVDQLDLSSVSARVQVTFFGRSKTISVSLNLKSMNIISLLAEEALPGVINFRRRRSVRSNAYEVFSQFLQTSAHHLRKKKELATLYIDIPNNNDYLPSPSPHSSVATIANRKILQILNETRNQFALERHQVRQQTVDQLSEATNHLAVSWNKSANPEMNVSSTKLNKTLQTNPGKDKCTTLTLLTRLTKTFSTHLWNVYREWKYSVSQFSTEVRQHHLETFQLKHLKENLTFTVASEIENLESYSEGHTEIMEQFRKDAKEEDVLLDDVTKEILAWDNAVGGTLTQLNQIGGQQLLKTIDSSFRDETGMTFVLYLQQQLQKLDNSLTVWKITTITKQLSKKSLTKMTTLTAIMTTKIRQLEKNMKCRRRRRP